MRLLIVEDEPAIAESLARALSRLHRVDVAARGDDALSMTLGNTYDLVILDLGLPDMDGMDVLRALRKREQHVPVLILSARSDLEDRVSGLDLGADDYIAKPFELDELEARVRAVARRAIARRGDEVRIGNLRLAMSEQRVYAHEQPLELTPREFSVLEFLLMRQGRVVPKPQLLEHLSEGEEGLSDGAVELYVHRVRRKIEHSGCSIRTLRGFGYVLEIEDAG